ncbi:hypothetical protein M5X00_05450 [Paenibacillus alvei]|uniref:hypothetical protein n=1 Tax=Paenibacillus alvei TaxID=44250 RepID=UPI000287B4B7|nr:hypothetical protein [Paenibacillus alvei]EJW19378.1 hypothetical protein PAV_1c03520 [Paenibacillus alvei DSM 29]MCY9707342.1 hypothetical protein [Paenibacillus alvei]MCY9753703.1 hypothetical protein [Paenibacillus alvei]
MRKGGAEVKKKAALKEIASLRKDIERFETRKKANWLDSHKPLSNKDAALVARAFASVQGDRINPTSLQCQINEKNFPNPYYTLFCP